MDCLGMVRRAGRRGGARGLARARQGAAALEFAIIAVPFVSLLLVIFEVGFDAYVQTALDLAVSEATRAIKTGQAQNITSADTFKANYICPNIVGLLNCANIAISSQQVSTDYYNTVFPSPTDGSGNLSLGTYQNGFTTGAANNSMYFQAVMQTPSFLGRLVPGLSNGSGAGRVHLTISSFAFRNENF